MIRRWLYRFKCWRRRRAFNKCDPLSKALIMVIGDDPDSLERREQGDSEGGGDD